MIQKMYRINKVPCDHKDCEDVNTTPCTYVIYKHDQSAFKTLFKDGLRQVWRDGCVEILDGHYCAEHAYEKGFCWTCGSFYSGASERFDFNIGGQWLCDGCWSNFQSEYDDCADDSYYYPGPWDD